MKKIPAGLQSFKRLDFYAICNHFTYQTKHILVAMVHLHHNPEHDLIKYAQMCSLLQQLHAARQKIGSNNVALVLAGDWNAQPTNQVYRLDVQGAPPTMKSLQSETMVLPNWLADRQSWFPIYQKLFEQTEHCTIPLASVYAQYHDSRDGQQGEEGHPRYTNLTDGFANTIDYIVYDSSQLKLSRFLEFDTELYEKEKYLPSWYHASDHVILWAEFETT